MDPTKIDGVFPKAPSVDRTPKTDAIPGTGKGGASATPVRPEADRTQAASVNSVQSVNAEYESADGRLPFEILNDSRLANSEWAWRNLLFAAFQSASTEVDSTSGSSPMPEDPVQVEQGTKVLWTLLSNLSSQTPLPFQTTSQPSWQSAWKGEVPENHLIPFRTISKEKWDQQNETVKRWVLQDRLVSSVQTSPYERSGAGMFFPREEGRPSEPTVRWTARRQTKLASQGRLVHRIEFEVMVGADLLKCTMTSSTPTLLLHFETDNQRLRNHLSAGKQIVQPLLSKHGFELHQWSVSPLPTSEEE